MKSRLFLTIGGALICALVVSCHGQKAGVPEFDYESLNAQAALEYLQPVHPGVRGEVPFWNPYSFKFIYAPAFDLDDVEGADCYQYTVTAADKQFTFLRSTPREALSPVWNEIPVGPVQLTVQAMNDDGEPVGEPQSRKFERDNPFYGPYDPAPRSYREAAVMAAEFIHNSPVAQGWLGSGELPSLRYELNCYPNKIWGGTIQIECALARLKPEYEEEALKVAHAAADALISHSQPADGALPYFPPTYYSREGVEYIWYIQRVIDRNRDYTMFADAVMAANALLDLYDTTSEQKYFDHALHIAQTYRDLQAEDGSWPVKVNWNTGESITPARCMPTSILQLAQRLHDRYGVKGFEKMIATTEDWLWKNTISNFNFNGQFEDVTVTDKASYQNLTNCIAVDCIDYFLNKPKPSKKEIAACMEMARFAEDQFTRWHSPVEEDADADADAGESFSTPFVFEQYSFQCPIDASTVGVANAWMNIYEATGDLLSLAKAKTLVDSIVKIQDPDCGCIPTSLYQDASVDISEHWVNCTYSSIKKLLRLDSILSND
ncbi:MAG: hypothetical protein J6X89_01360 [Bacteroidales bacterium]|nr:hypothetical protein [Bacteroidales bacterium]